MASRWISHRMSDEERWPVGQRDPVRCHCGAWAKCCEYRLKDGDAIDERYVCLLHSIGSTRISCNLPDPLLARLERQAELMAVTRQYLIEQAIETTLFALEDIDEELARDAG